MDCFWTSKKVGLLWSTRCCKLEFFCILKEMLKCWERYPGEAVFFKFWQNTTTLFCLAGLGLLCGQSTQCISPGKYLGKNLLFPRDLHCSLQCAWGREERQPLFLIQTLILVSLSPML